MKIKISDLLASKISKVTDCVFSGQGGFVIHILDSLKKIKKIKIIPKTKKILISRHIYNHLESSLKDSTRFFKKVNVRKVCFQD